MVHQDYNVVIHLLQCYRRKIKYLRLEVGLEES